MSLYAPTKYKCIRRISSLWNGACLGQCAVVTSSELLCGSEDAGRRLSGLWYWRELFRIILHFAFVADLLTSHGSKVPGWGGYLLLDVADEVLRRLLYPLASVQCGP